MQLLRLSLTAAALFAVAQSPASAFLIDDFSGTQTVVQSGLGANSSDVAVVGAVGGSRYMEATVTAGNGDLELGSNVPTAGAFSHSQDVGVTGSSLLRWDGVANSALDFGLGGVDLTDGGSSTGIALRLISTDFPVNISLTVWEDAGNYSTAMVLAPALSSNIDFFIDFASFTAIGLGADFASAEAIELSINDMTGYADADVRIDFIESTTDVAEPATLALFGLGLIGLGVAQRRRTSGRA